MEYGFFFAKYFGSGVIIATAFIHVSPQKFCANLRNLTNRIIQLLAPAADALTNPCLTGPITSYDWAEGICLIMVFVLFFVELMTVRYATFSHDHSHEEERHRHSLEARPQSRRLSTAISPIPNTVEPQEVEDTLKQQDHAEASANDDAASTHQRGDDHLGHGRDHDTTADVESNEAYSAQITAIFILEFGVIFHSIFIGLTLAVAGDEFIPLYVVLVFHQTFEGLGLGTRLASTPWPKSKHLTPYWMAIAFGISTPTAIAIGLGVRNAYPPQAQTTLIVNGIFDAISAGILIYTGLVELMAHEFMFSPRMRKEPFKVVVTAYLQMCLGAGLMALLGKWA
jgi:solute carrier family 39 (zinc transporter), member 1/2/3